MAKVWSGKVALPPKEEMWKWVEEQERKEREEKGFKIGFLGYPEDAEYVDFLAGMAGEEGWKWGPWERWVRKHTPEMKRRFLERVRDTGERVRRMEELGFVYPGEGWEDREGEEEKAKL